MKLRDIQDPLVREKAFFYARRWRESEGLFPPEEYLEGLSINKAFIWGDTPEGYAYWEEFAEQPRVTVEQAKEVLRAAGYYVDNLWQISDVTTQFENASQDQAYDILDSVMQSEYLVGSIFDQIITSGLSEGLTLRTEESGNKTF